MRKIKFRQWDPDDKKMEYEIPLCHTELNDELNEANGYSPLMQYTGLADMNGKEVFESDLVKAHGDVFEVIWYYPICGFAGKRVDDKREMPIQFDMCEVIGNIYENPNLLKDA